MFVIGNFLIAVAQVLNMVLSLVWILILVRAVISWFSPDPFNPLVQMLYRATEPILVPIRRRLPAAGIDFSPLVAWLVIMFVQAFVVQSLFDLGRQMKM